MNPGGHNLHSEQDHAEESDVLNCIVCTGALSMCKVCGGGEAALPTECPGNRMTAEQLDAVQAGTLDYKAGSWWRKEGLAPDRGDGRKSHYGSGKQPWDTIKECGWEPEWLAGNVVKYLRRTKEPAHSLESARVYFKRLVELASSSGRAAAVRSILLQELTGDECQRLGGLQDVERLNRLVGRFLAWSLPPGVSACATGTGRNLMTADDARKMIIHLLHPEGLL